MRQDLWLHLLAAAVCLGTPGLTQAQRAVFMLRHAERAEYDDGDGLLSKEGEARAQRLAEVLSDAGIGSIYISRLKRTRQTAEPLARLLKLEPTVITTRDGEYAAEMRKLLSTRHQNDIVLIIGHLNTFLPLLYSMGHPEEIKIEDFEHDDLFVVIPKPKGRPTVLRLNY